MGEESGGAGGRSPVNVTLYPLDDCAPCDVVKEAFHHEDLARYAPVQIERLDIDDIRELRRQLGRLSFPILVARIGGAVVSHRMGAETADPATEREALSVWLGQIERSVRKDPAGAASF